jgi:hypothetical protein
VARLVGALDDAEPRVRREAALSIRVLLRQGARLSRRAAAKLEGAGRHPDEVVRRRVGEAVRYLVKDGR